MGNLGKKALTNITILLLRDSLSRLVKNLTSNAINEFEKKKKISGKRAVRAVKVFTWFISDKDINDITKSKTIKSLENSGLLIDGVTETVKHETKKQESGFLGALLRPLAASVVQPVIFSVVKDIRGRRIRGAGKEYMDKNF